jgi:mannose-6-phosphate isomerase-like protein (cupin superfamily)
MTRDPLLQPSADLIVDLDDVGRRIIEPHQFMADTEAFIDVRLPESVGKASYSFIGPGVSQNANQIINLAEPHGFNIGAASMPHGVVNNPHMHYTAEVFICTRGRWEMRLGQYGEQTVEIGPNTLFSVPTWIFRGFKNIGADDGWLLTVLGSDNTGGILWAPQVLEAAAATGLHLSTNGAVLDATAGELTNDTITPIDETRLGELDHYTDAEIAERIVAPGRLNWSEVALLSSVLPGHGSAMAPVIGFGLTEDRQQRPPIWTPHGFTVEWLRLEPGASTGLHRIDQNQALFLVEGEWQVTYNRLDNQISRTVAEDTVVSIPGSCWRELTNIGSAVATCLVVCAGDNRARADWDPRIENAAAEAGWGRDANGYIAPLDLLGGAPW